MLPRNWYSDNFPTEDAVLQHPVVPAGCVAYFHVLVKSNLKTVAFPMNTRMRISEGLNGGGVPLTVDG